REKGSKIVYSAQIVWQGFDGTTQVGRKFRALRFASFNRSMLENSNFISQFACLHERSLTEQSGGFDEALERFVDGDFFLRLTEGEVACGLPCILSHYYMERTATSVTRSQSTEAAFEAVHQRLVGRSG